MPWTGTPGQFKAPFNDIYNMHHVATPEDTAIITPNSDTPYSMLWLDLRAEPMVISVPAVEKGPLLFGPAHRRQHLQFRLYRHARDGTEPGDYLVVGPDWKADAPTGIRKVFRSTTPFTFAAFRTQLFNPGDMPNVEKVQSGYKAQPLSAFLKQPAPPAAPKIAFLPATTAGIKDNFFPYLDAALRFVPETPRDEAIRAKLARIGIGPGKTFAFQGSAARTQGRNPRRHEAGRRQGGQMAARRKQERQRLENRLVLRRRGLLQRRLADAGRGRQGRHLWQRCRRSHVPLIPGRT